MQDFKSKFDSQVTMKLEDYALSTNQTLMSFKHSLMESREYVTQLHNELDELKALRKRDRREILD
jgi:hypothetical protein